jgi:CubicO group peptidase (beta-lactamase class C family)
MQMIDAVPSDSTERQGEERKTMRNFVCRRPSGFLRSASGLALLFAALTAAAADPSAKTELPSAKPEDVGMSSERLPRINAALQRHIDAGQLAGAVTLIARRGKVVHFETHGWADLESKQPMSRDTLFKMASTTKPVTSVAILMLMEEGKLRLTDPVSRFIPEFKDTKVAVAKSGGEEVELVPAQRPITIRDLLTHTSGLGSGGAGSKETGKVMQARKPTDTLADFIPQLGAAPLDFQPGTQWRYSGGAGFDVLARIVEVASGQSFDQFLRQRLFEPLGMKDTFFVVPDDRKPRLGSIYRGTAKGLEKLQVPGFFASTTYFSGAGGLTSSTEDYARFALMLVNGGELNGKRILSPRTVKLIGSNHVGTLFGGQLGRPPQGLGFGLGVEVVQDAVTAGWRRSNDSYGWDGAFGTIFEVDPREQMIAVLMMQRYSQEVYRDFENAVRQAIID